jgi:hypothetical protein
MHLMSFGDAFGFLLFMLFMFSMVVCLLIQKAWKVDRVKATTKVIGRKALNTGASWILGKLKRK